MSAFESFSTKENGLVSTNNSTTTALIASAVFTGSYEDTLNYSNLIVSIKADQSSIVDGLVIQWSSDGLSITQTDEMTVSANTGKVFTFTPANRYFRIMYTNGTTPQASLDIQCILKKHGIKPSSHRVSDSIVGEDDATLTTTVLKVFGSDPDTLENVDVQHPLPADGDSVYLKDIDITNSSNGGFSGTVTDYFDSLKTVNADSSATNPKTITIQFKRTLQTRAIGFGCDNLAKNFSNIKIMALGSGDEVRYTKDLSSDNTKRNSFLVELPQLAMNGVIIEFHTADEVALSNLIIFKTNDVQATISAVKPSGDVVNIGATNNNNLRVSVNEYGDTPSIDAFARLRVSESFTIFDSKQLHDKQPVFWDESLGGAATSVHTPVNAATEMTVTASAADYVIRQTKQRFNYQPGKSQLIMMTLHSPQISGVSSRIGIFDGTGVNNLDPNNGIFFECDGGLSWNIAKDGTIAETATQAQWNHDKLDGTGNSGINLDMTATQILIIDYEWLGVGRVRVGFVIDGLIYYCHYFNHGNDNSFASVYMSSPNLPLRYSIETDGTNGSTLDHICSTVISEGGVEKTGILRSFDMGINAVTAVLANTPYVLLGLRLKELYKDISIIPESFSVLNKDKEDYYWSLHFNPVISGTMTYVDQTDSALQLAIGVGTQIITSPGLVFASGYVSDKTREAGDALLTAQRIGSNIDGTKDTMVLSITALTNNRNFLGSLGIRELL